MEAGGDDLPIVHYERDLPDAARRSLLGTGVPTAELAAHDDGAGHAQLIRGGPERFEAASDPRADGTAVTDKS
jgi:gamma-glutamyltranspeptidase/glutathione hydrolase